MPLARQTNKQAGFTLLELMVAMIIMLIVMAAILSQVKTAFLTTNTTFEMTEAQQNLRIAQEYVNRDLISTGNGLKGINNIRLPIGFVQNYITTAPVTNPSDPDYVTLSIITSDDNVPAATAVAGANPAVNLLVGTDRITILAIDPAFTPVGLPSNAINAAGSNVSLTAQQFASSNFQTGGIYFINSEYGATFGSITNIGGNVNSPNLVFDNSDPYSLNQPGASSGSITFVSRGPNNQAVPTSLMRMFMTQYFVNANGVLIRRVFGARGGAGFVDSIISENVTNLQFRYILSDFAQPVTQLTTAQQQVGVRQVEVTVTVRTEHGVINGAPQSISTTTSTSVRNLQFREAL